MDIFEQAGQQYNVDPQLLRAQMQVESGGNPNAVSPQGAQGAMQLMPATAKSLGVANPFDANQSVMGAAKLMAENLDRYGDVQKAVAAYHGGTDPANWGPKTQAYVQKVASNYGGKPMPAQQSDMPGLPPINAQQSAQVDPFAGLQGGQNTASAAPPQQVDPFAGLNSNQTPQKPAIPKVAAAPSNAPGSQPGALMSFGAGLGHGVQQTVLGAQQLLGRGLTSMGSDTVGPWLTQDAEQGIARGNADYAPYSAAHPVAAGAGNIGGNVAATAPLALMAPEVAGMGLMGRAATGAALGAANGAVAPVENPSDNFWQQKGKQIGMNAAVGAAAVPFTSALGSVIRGVTDPVRRSLANSGVTMTPGQLAGGVGQTIENTATSLPIIGDFVRSGQQRAIQDFNRAAYQNVLDPIGAQLPNDIRAGSNGIAYVRNQIGNVYNGIEPRANFTMDQNFATDLNGIRNNLSQMAPGALPQFDNIVQNQITGKLAGAQGGGIGGTMTGSQWGDTRSMIDRFARAQTRGDASVDQIELGNSLRDLNSAVSDAVGRSSPPDVLPTLQRANASYAQYKQIERAASQVGARNNGNVFTPDQFSSSVNSNASQFQKATNSGLNGQFAADAKSVLGAKYPDSGTAGRLGTAGAIGALVSHPGLLMNPWTYAAMAPALAYTPMGQRAVQGLMMNRPAFAQPVANAVTNGLAPLMPGLFGALSH